MIGRKTIIVEDRLKAIFDYLPAHVVGVDSFKPVFKSGDQKELLAFFKQSTQKTNYPLIWLDMPYEENHRNRNRVDVDSLSLILAVETNSEMLNAERLSSTYKPVLYPLLDNVIDVFTVANILTFNQEFTITKFPNYSDDTEGNESGFSDIWDAIKLTIQISLNDNCLREIKI